ncbi:MAG: hypothetical protein AAF514_01180 [Verrucomicrobiota bacterium]
MTKLKKKSEVTLPTTVHGLATIPGSRALVAACLDGALYHIQPEGGEPTPFNQKHESFASGVQVLPDGKTAISGGYDGCLIWHEIESGKTIRKVEAHEFWSWRTSLSPDGRLLASSTGQYLCGGYKYEPAPEREPSVKVYDTATGELVHSLTHIPPVQSVAFSRDGKRLAAGNLMGEIRLWDLSSGNLLHTWNTPDFTGWGIIKGHYFTGGIFSLAFGPQDNELFAAGMGTTRDPAAGNGVQLWQRFSVRENTGQKSGQAREDQIGKGLMEHLAFHPSDRFFVMAGRLEAGNWNAALFDTASGERIAALDAKGRITSACFNTDGDQLLLAGGVSQKRKDQSFAPYGRIRIFELTS